MGNRKSPWRRRKIALTVGVTISGLIAASPEARHYVTLLVELILQFM